MSNLSRDFGDACKHNDIARIRYALDNGIDVNKPVPYDTMGSISHERPICLLFLLHHNEKFEEKRKCLRVLLDAGADVNVSDKNGKPLIFTLLRNSLSLRVLLQHRADINTMYEGVTVMHWAAKFYNLSAIPVLLEFGMDPNVRTNPGDTPLHYSMSSEIDQVLLQNGADPRLRNKLGYCAGEDKLWAQSYLRDWTPFKILPVWSFTHKAFSMYTDHCPGFRDAMMTLLLCLMRNRILVCRDVSNMIVAHVAQGHKQDQWWPIVGFSIKEYI